MATPQRGRRGQPPQRSPQYPTTGDPLLDQLFARAEFQPGATDLRDNLAEMVYLVKDEKVERILERDPSTESLMVGTSPLVRTGRRSKKARRIAKLRWENSCITALLCKRKPKLVDLALYNNLLIFGNGAIDDTDNGWRGLLVTNKMRTIRVERGQTRRRGVLEFLGVR